MRTFFVFIYATTALGLAVGGAWLVLHDLIGE